MFFEMFLAIDIGNTLTHAGLFDDLKLKKKIIFPTDEVLTNHELPRKVTVLALKPITKIGISSVVPKANVYWKYLTKKYFDINPVFVQGKMKLPINLEMKMPGKIGSDRLCNAVAGYEYFKRSYSVIIIDLGTATTYDIVLKNGTFIGGIIAPGIRTSADALHQKTARLPLVSEKFYFPVNPIGKDTVSAMSSGISYSALDSVEGMVRRLNGKLKVKFKIILTGGFAELIKQRVSFKAVIRKDLVLEGINHILRHSNV